MAWCETLRDWRDTTHPDGVPWDITPGKRRFNTRDFTLAAAVKLPWDLHTFYGDRRALEESYELMRRSVAHFEKWSEKPGSPFVKGLGDWLDPNPPFVKVTKPTENTYGGHAASKFTPNRLTATALRHHATDLLAKTAVLLGKDEDAVRYRKSAAEIRHAFNQRYYRPDPQSYGSQCADSYAVPGFKHFFLRPTLCDHLEFARGRYRSSHGDIVSDWRNKGEDFHWEIVIPPNTEATVHLPRRPGGQVTESGQPFDTVKEIRVLSETARHLELRVPAGRYLFTFTRKKP